MAIYVYESISEKPGEATHRFEFQQSMRDAPLTHHPVTGERLKRIIVGGYGIMSAGGKNQPNAASTPAPCSAGCACHSGPRVPQP